MSYWQKRESGMWRRVARGLRGLGVDNVTCDPGEVFDLTAMMCVQAGSATTPILVPQGSVVVPSPTSVPRAPTSSPPTTSSGPLTNPTGSLMSMSGPVPWLLGGVVAVGLFIIAGDRR